MPDGYEFVRALGHGAHGSVVLARQLRLDRLVAIKTVHTGMHDPVALRRLEREGQAVVALRHPGIVSVYELCRTELGTALVMEYVPGGDLSARLASRDLVPAHAAAIVCGIADAITHAHGAGIVHRDIKPANVLLTADGRVKITDFGLARLTRSATAYRTSDDLVAGTPAYLAPEQILDPGHEHHASDTYALSVLAYELLVGRRPFSARTVDEFVEAHVNSAPLDPWLGAPDLPRAVGQALLAGLVKQPGARGTAQELADAVRRVPAADWDAAFASRRATIDPTAHSASGPGSRSASRSVVPPARLRARRRPRPAATHRFALLGAAVLGGVLAGVVIVLIGRWR